MLTKKQTRRQVLATAAATGAVAAVGVTTANAQNAVGAFYQSGEYTYCDAKILASYWGNSPYQAKVVGGEKILAGNAATLRAAVKEAVKHAGRNGIKCTFADANNPPYSYNDAVLLANYWTRQWGRKMTPYDAKLKIALNIEGGGNLWVRGELAKARRGG